MQHSRGLSAGRVAGITPHSVPRPRSTCGSRSAVRTSSPHWRQAPVSARWLAAPMVDTALRAGRAHKRNRPPSRNVLRRQARSGQRHVDGMAKDPTPSVSDIVNY